jgi:hydroxyacylglutathione hydrolase
MEYRQKSVARVHKPCDTGAEENAMPNQIFLRRLLIAILFSLIAAFAILSCSSKVRTASSPGALTDEIKATYIVSEEAEGVWKIDENGQANMFLIVGNDKAMLVDSGCGEAGLDATVASLTKLPVIVVNTHGHNDHAMGNSYFSDIYAHPDDMWTVKGMSGGSEHFTEVSEGYVFDLGGRKLSVIDTPGHTKGSICLLDAENRILVSGDNNGYHVWLFLAESLSVEEYLVSLERLIARSNEFDLVLLGHGASVGSAHLLELAENCKAILRGGITPDAYKYGASSYGPNGALIAYDPRKIFAPKE